MKEKDFSTYGAQLFKSGLQTPILRYLQDYRRKITGMLRLEFYRHHFEVAPQKGVADFDVNQWQLKSNYFFLDSSWHCIGDDPFGLVSVHVATPLIMK